MSAVVITAWSALDELPPAPRALWPDAPARLGRMDRPAVRALLAAHRALSSLAAPLGPRDDIGVIVGTALGCADANDLFHAGLVRDGAAGASPLLFAQTIPSTPTGEVAIAFGLRGHAATLMVGRASGVAAVAEAVRAMRLGRCAGALVIAGDVTNDHRERFRRERGEAPSRDATVALLLERADATPRRAFGTITRASLTHDGDAAPDARETLGAAGLVELVSWLDGGAASCFTAAVRCPSGRVGALEARRP